MSKPPLFLNLLKIRLPITAKASITHRISAIGVAERVSDEVCEKVGAGFIGYQIRLERRASEKTKLLYLSLIHI